MRRSDYPAVLDRTRLEIFTDGFVPSSDMTMPTRLNYPELEQQYNSVNYQEALDRMGGKDDWHKQLWWDKYDLNVQETFTPPFGKGYIK